MNTENREGDHQVCLDNHDHNDHDNDDNDVYEYHIIVIIIITRCAFQQHMLLRVTLK